MSQHRATWRNNNNTGILPAALFVFALLAAATMIALQTDHPSAIASMNASSPKLALVAAAPAAPVEKSIDIGGGYVLKINAEGGAVVPSNPAIVKSWPESSYKSVDIGGGYILKTNADGGMVLPSSPAIVKGEAAAWSKAIDIGGGYVLKLNAEGGVVVPSSPAIIKSQPEASHKTIDLGAGYTLVYDGNDATIQAPPSRPVTAP